MEIAYGEMWSPVNGLMLPKPAEEAWKDLALTIVPDNSLDTIRSGNDHRNREYKFCVMDGKHPAVSRSLYKDLALYGLPEVTIEQFDNKRVNFGNTYRPRIDYFYFQSCSAVWKKTYLEDPECDDETNFVARFLSGITQYWHPKYVEKSRITDKSKEGQIISASLFDDLAIMGYSVEVELLALICRTPWKLKYLSSKQWPNTANTSAVDKGRNLKDHDLTEVLQDFKVSCTRFDKPWFLGLAHLEVTFAVTQDE
ncbi:hypothetical protein N0V82_003010 [Gnomoniopsis sp. IMI 355080]|nr:hypothetical protein N0V82_003010 [Gnomoniopsis sp. IMI 355080]